MGVGWATSAAALELITGALDHNWVLEGSYRRIISLTVSVTTGLYSFFKYLCGQKEEASCRKYRRLASFQGFPDARDR